MSFSEKEGTNLRSFFNKKTSYRIATLLGSLCILTACGESSPSVSSVKPNGASSVINEVSTPSASSVVSEPETLPKGSRDNTPICLVPAADGILVSENDVASIDYSHSSDGYVSVKYTGEVEKIKLRITGPDEVVYTYDLKQNTYEVFPLTGGNGAYSIAVYENVEGTNYVTAHFDTIDVQIDDEIKAYLYPNQYVDFKETSDVVKLAKEIVEPANSDLDAVSYVYNYIISNITYDFEKAESNPTGYISDIDTILKTKTGICLDYAAIMCSMLRSQGIPTRLEIGYAADAYHAWISVYISDIGWVNGVVEFTGSSWTLMDPTFGASTDDAALKKFIGDGTNYTLQKIY